LAYGLPLVSYRDVIWPKFASPPAVCARGCYRNNSDIHAHVGQGVLHLVSDVLAVAWVSLETRLEAQGAADMTAAVDATAATAGEREALTARAERHGHGTAEEKMPLHPGIQPLPSARLFPDVDPSEGAAAVACEDGGWLTSKHHGRGATRAATSAAAPPGSFRPVDRDVPPAGWAYLASVVAKEGWQFEATFSAPHLPAAANASTPVTRWRLHQRMRASTNSLSKTTFDAAVSLYLDEATRLAEQVDTHEPLTFSLRFGAHPRLAVTHLRSYANFGRALYWFDGRREAALAAYRDHLRLELACFAGAQLCRQLGQHSYRTDPARAAEKEHSCHMTLLRHSIGKDACTKPLIGEKPPHKAPFVIDGHWEARSSQAATVGLLGFERVRHSGSLPFYAQNVSRPPTTPGWHNVSFAMLSPDFSTEAMAMLMEASVATNSSLVATLRKRVVFEGEAERCPFACHEGSRFKILSLHSC